MFFQEVIAKLSKYTKINDYTIDLKMISNYLTN